MKRLDENDIKNQEQDNRIKEKKMKLKLMNKRIDEIMLMIIKKIMNNE
jgi:hypothetical protein